MGQARFLTSVHARVRDSARTGSILDVYRLADELIAEDVSYQITRGEAADTVIAACVVYGASLWLDPGDAHGAVKPVRRAYESALTAPPPRARRRVAPEIHA